MRRLLHAHGLRFRVDYPIVAAERTIRVDVAFPRQKLAVFIDGCFWHGCPEHGTMPKHNRDYWEQKIKRNQVRDSRQTRLIEGSGWTVLRYWTHSRPEDVANAVQDVLAIKMTDMEVDGGR